MGDVGVVVVRPTRELNGSFIALVGGDKVM